MDTLTKDELISCLELGKELVSELNPDRLIEKILNKLSELIPAKNWSLLLVDSETGELCFNLCVGLDGSLFSNIRLKPGEGIAGKVASEQVPLIIEDVSKSEFFAGRIDSLSGFKTKSIICVPLLYHGETVGVLEAVNPSSLEKRVMVILNLIAQYTAIAVENTRLYRAMEYLSDHDNLTGLYNTRYMYRDLTERIGKSEGGKEIFSLLFMDIDNFKKVVVKYGHLTGSFVIRDVARTIKEALKKDEYCVSYAGDEFVIFLPDADREKSLKRIEEIKQVMSRASYTINNQTEITFTASFGIASFPEDEETLAGLLNRADKAMFHMKGMKI